MKNIDMIPNPKEQPELFAAWYLKKATGLEAADHEDLIMRFVKWLGKEAE